jgi:putative DNA primase/helicase
MRGDDNSAPTPRDRAAAEVEAELSERRRGRPARPELDDDRNGFDPRDPLMIARVFAKMQGDRPLLHHADTFYKWTGAHYAALADSDVTAMVREFLETSWRRSKDGPTPFKPTKRDVDEVAAALRDATHVASRITPPAWLDGRDDDDGPLIACKNGLLRLSDGVLLPHRADYFNTSALDFDYDAAAPEPVEWLKFLASLWPDDQKSIDTLQEIFGYILAGDKKHEKIFLIVGLRRSGKGTIARTLRRLIGKGGSAGPTLDSLAKPFGLEPIINKRLVVVPDARLRGPSHEIVERLLAISGNDELTIDRKHKSAWTGELPARLVVLTNEVPALADSSGALSSRFIMLHTTISFLGREDKSLGSKLAREMAGIFNWALAGWRRLEARGWFDEPDTSKTAREKFDAQSRPIESFLADCCELGTNYKVGTKTFYAAWRQWCAENGRDRPGNDASFGRDLHAAHPEIVKKQLHVGERIYDGVRLRVAAQESLIQIKEPPPPDSAAEAAACGPPVGFDENRPPAGGDVAQQGKPPFEEFEDW